MECVQSAKFCSVKNACAVLLPLAFGSARACGSAGKRPFLLPETAVPGYRLGRPVRGLGRGPIRLLRCALSLRAGSAARGREFFLCSFRGIGQHSAISRRQSAKKEATGNWQLARQNRGSQQSAVSQDNWLRAEFPPQHVNRGRAGDPGFTARGIALFA